MKYVLYPVFAFWLIWLFWYLSGGPLRSEKSHPFITPADGGGFEYVDKVNSGFDEVQNLKNKIQNN
jgi:hypothetical protein